MPIPEARANIALADALLQVQFRMSQEVGLERKLGSMVPAGEFCGHCGAHLTRGDAFRHGAFAAVPSEPVSKGRLCFALALLEVTRGGVF